MDTFYEISPGLLKRSALALGFFDGVHPGHQVVIATAVKKAKDLGAVPAVVTFKEHPRALTLGKSPPLLTLIDQRLELFAELGIEAALVLSFTEELCRLAPEDYVKAVLVDCLGAKALSVGYNHRFGRNRVGDPKLLERLGIDFGYTVDVAGEVIVDGAPVSSSRIRDAVSQGEVAVARHLLCRPYAIAGLVQHGDRRGHLIGFPTANLKVPDEQVVPETGVYAGIVRLPGPEFTRRPCVVNIGKRPTFGDNDNVTTEIHIFDFSGDLYDAELSLEFIERLRTEKKFGGAEELKQQIAADCQAARQILAAEPELLSSLKS